MRKSLQGVVRPILFSLCLTMEHTRNFENAKG